jgi:hypothetical protein
MNEIINKLVQYLRECFFLIDYDPDSEEKSHFSVSVSSNNSVIEYFIKVADVDWSSGKIVVTFHPGTRSTPDRLINILDSFNPKE